MRLFDWLIDTGADLPPETRLALIHSLYGSLAIFIGGVLNTIAVSTIIASRIPATIFFVWAAAEILLAAARIPVLLAGRRAIAEGRRGPVELHVLLALLWAMAVGYGSFISILSGDWVVATLACLSGAAMIGGVCFRNFAAPRLAAAMILLSLGPCAVAAVLSGETMLLIVGLQIPMYLFSMTVAAFHLNKMLVRTMLAERENDWRARHDLLTGLLNRAGLAKDAADRTATDEPFALLYLDLDGFKTVNDTFGHQFGDELLKAVAERLRLIGCPEDSIARIGGDEFVILHGGDPAAALEFGDLVVGAIAQGSYRIGSEFAEVGASVGVAFFPEHGNDLGALLGEADTALYKAKFWGRSRCVISGGNPIAQLPTPAARPVRLERDAA
jgi:diguanylate cyclase (GGDEF)-like protein